MQTCKDISFYVKFIKSKKVLYITILLGIAKYDLDIKEEEMRRLSKYGSPNASNSGLPTAFASGYFNNSSYLKPTASATG